MRERKSWIRKEELKCHRPPSNLQVVCSPSVNTIIHSCLHAHRLLCVCVCVNSSFCEHECYIYSFLSLSCSKRFPFALIFSHLSQQSFDPVRLFCPTSWIWWDRKAGADSDGFTRVNERQREMKAPHELWSAEALAVQSGRGLWMDGSTE